MTDHESRTFDNIDQRFSEVREDFREVRTEMKAGFDELKTAVKEIDDKLCGKMATLEQTQDQHTIKLSRAEGAITLIGIIGTLVGIGAAVLNFLH